MVQNAFPMYTNLGFIKHQIIYNIINQANKTLAVNKLITLTTKHNFVYKNFIS